MDMLQRPKLSEEPAERPRRGRPVGARYRHIVRGNEDDEGLEMISRLCRLRGLGTAALFRVLVREEIRRAGIVGRDWSASAAEWGKEGLTPVEQEWLYADLGGPAGMDH